MNGPGDGAMRRALVIEDHPETRDWWLGTVPRLFPDTVADAVTTLQEARDLLRRREYWLAIVDINLPDGSGVDLVAEVSSTRPETLSVVCTIFDDDHHVFAALRAGAQGYLVKDRPREQQSKLLQEILHGQPPLSPGIARRILRHFSEVPQRRPGPGQEAEPEGRASLTDREVEVLRLIAKGYSRPETAGMLGLSVHTVATHTKSIYQKLGISRRAEAVVEAVRLGLVRSD